MENNLGNALKELGYSEKYIKLTNDFLEQFAAPECTKRFEGGMPVSIMNDQGIIEDFCVEEDCDSFEYTSIIDRKTYTEKIL